MHDSQTNKHLGTSCYSTPLCQGSPSSVTPHLSVCELEQAVRQALCGLGAALVPDDGAPPHRQEQGREALNEAVDLFIPASTQAQASCAISSVLPDTRCRLAGGKKAAARWLVQFE